MSGTIHRIEFSCTTRDTQLWSDDQSRKYFADDDIAVEALRLAMVKAGNSWIEANREMFSVDLDCNSVKMPVRWPGEAK